MKGNFATLRPEASDSLDNPRSGPESSAAASDLDTWNVALTVPDDRRLRSATLSPVELVGIEWVFPWSEGRQPYLVDVTLDNVRFTGGTGPTTVCPPFVQ